MPRLDLTILTLVVLAAPTPPVARDGATLTRMLNEFLAGASRDDAAVHDRFWAEDLIYTASSGRRFGKAELMQDVRSASAPSADEPKTIYSAEDVRIQQYGNAALVAFRLVATTTAAETTTVVRFLNSGMFLRRKGRWQAVGWQATRMP